MNPFLRTISLALLLTCGGCATLPTFRGPPPRVAESRPALPPGWNDFRGIIHCHSFLSHDSRGTFAEIQRACERVGVDFLIMTDHITTNSVPDGLRGRHGRTLFLVGAEFSKGGGSVLGLDLHRYLPHKKTTTAEVVEGIRSQGGMAVIAHAEKFLDWEVPGFEGMELYNIHANAAQEPRGWLALKAAFLPPGTLFRSLVRIHPPNFRRWDELTRQRRLPGVFGNDAHQNIHLFGPRAGFIGTYEQMFRIATTHVLAPSLDGPSVLAALRAGHCYGALEIWGDATGFVFSATNGDQWMWMGDEAVLASPCLLHVQLPASAQVRLLRDGVEIARVEEQNVTWPVADPGVYRVEVWLRGRPWIFSNPIYLRPPISHKNPTS